MATQHSRRNIEAIDPNDKNSKKAEEKRWKQMMSQFEENPALLLAAIPTTPRRGGPN